MTGSCANCLMQIDGIPNVRACIEPVRDGMRVERQNAWPSAGRDIHGWLNTFSFMMPPGFYYKVFQRPRWAWHLVEPFIRSKAGLGTVPRDEDHAPREVVNLHCDVLVIGGGSAGLAAAAEAAAAGAARSCWSSGPETDAEPGALATAVDAGVRSDRDAGGSACSTGRSWRPRVDTPSHRVRARAHRVRDRRRGAGGRVPEQRSAG